MLWAVGGLAVGGFVSGCGTQAPISQKDLAESETGEANLGQVGSSKATQPTVRLPKNVNPEASNKGLKGKYAD
jgi:hypothetical protein